MSVRPVPPQCGCGYVEVVGIGHVSRCVVGWETPGGPGFRSGPSESKLEILVPVSPGPVDHSETVIARPISLLEWTRGTPSCQGTDDTTASCAGSGVVTATSGWGSGWGLRWERYFGVHPVSRRLCTGPGRRVDPDVP